MNEGNIDDLIWPRTLAIAEVLWRDQLEKVQDAKKKLNKMVCSLWQLGIQSGTLEPLEPCPGVHKTKIALENWGKVEVEEEDDYQGWAGIGN